MISDITMTNAKPKKVRGKWLIPHKIIPRKKPKITSVQRMNRRRIQNEKQLENLQAHIETAETTHAEFTGLFAATFGIKKYDDALNKNTNNKTECARQYKRMVAQIKRKIDVTRYWKKQFMNNIRKKDKDHKICNIWDVSINLSTTKSKTQFVPWFQIRKSTINGAGLGCFSLRSFNKDDAIGFYMSKLCTKADG